jgi:sortase A
VRSSVPRFDDDPELTGLDGDNRREAEVWRRFVNRVLLLVEVAAVAGLVFLGVNMVTAIGTLERETAEAQEMANEQRLATIPTPAPTPTVRLQEYVLPGGHTFTDDNVAIFNENEIPPQVLPRVQNQLYQQVLSRPEPTDSTALRLEIPALGLTQSIVQGTDWEALKQGVGQVQNSVTPADQQGNVVLAAHNDIYGELFRNINELEIGDLFYIHTAEEVYTYRVTGQNFVDPTDISVMENNPGEATATLISCWPYRVNTQRIVVFAERVS